MAGLVSGGRVMVERERETGRKWRRNGSEVRCGWAEGETRQRQGKATHQGTRRRGRSCVGGAAVGAGAA